MSTKTFPEGALNISPNELVYELILSAEETVIVLSGPAACIFSPTSKYVTTALEGIGAGVGRGADVDLEAHE